MSSANIWVGNGGFIPVVNALGNIQEQWGTASAGTTQIDLIAFTYTPNTRSVFVYVNGVMQQRGVDYTETSSTRITLTSPLNAGDKVCVIAYAIYGALSS